MKHKHIFDLNVPSLSYLALGDSSVRIIAIHAIIQEYELDAIIIPPRNRSLQPLWRRAFKEKVYSDKTPRSHQLATISSPSNLDHWFGSFGFNVFESVFWENGFFDTANLQITPPTLFRCDPSSHSVMIYPVEHTDGNRVYDSNFWLETTKRIRDFGYKINMLGTANERLQQFFDSFVPDRQFPANIEGLEKCITASSLAIGASTGPTWACLLSDIPQCVLESKQSPHGYWHFDRCKSVLTKELSIIQDIGTIFK